MSKTAEFMDMAQAADRRALFAALQRTLIQLQKARFEARDLDAYDRDLEYIRAGLEIGAELGSPEQLAARR